MAHISFEPIVLRCLTTANTGGCEFRTTVGYIHRGDDTDFTAFTLLNVKVRSIHVAKTKVGNTEISSLRYVLEPDTVHALPDVLPFGWTIIYEPDPTLDYEMCPVVALDTNAISGWVREKLVQRGVPVFLIKDQISKCSENLSLSAQDDLAAKCSIVFDCRDTDDLITRLNFSVVQWTDGLRMLYIRDSRHPWVKPRDLGWAINDLSWSRHPKNANMDIHDRRLVQMVMCDWGSRIEQIYQSEFDKVFTAHTLNAARKAASLGTVDARISSGVAHEFKYRKLRIEENTWVPFPMEDMLYYPPRLRILSFLTTPSGGYKRAQQRNLMAQDEQDYVLVHYINNTFRFFFVDHVDWFFNVGRSSRMSYIMPVVVPERECAKQMPINPQRGMDPRVTAAIAGTHYMASAMSHAFNRRAYLRSLIDWTTGKPNWHAPYGVLLRSMSVKPDRYSKAGRRITRNLSQCPGPTLDGLLALVGPSQLHFGDVQRVAPAKAEKRTRPIRLDL